MDLRPYPTPLAADGIDGHVEICEFGFRQDSMFRVMEGNCRFDRRQWRRDIGNDGAKTKPDSPTAQQPMQFAVRQGRDNQVGVCETS